MLSIKYLTDHKTAALNRLKKRKLDAADLIDKVIALDEERKKVQHELDQLNNKMKLAADAIHQLFKSGNHQEGNAKKEEVGAIKKTVQDVEEKLKTVAQDLHDHLVQLPNVPHELVPAGVSDEDNEIVFTITDLPQLTGKPKPHWELAAQHDIIDFELGNKITGSGFPVYKGKGAKLQRALIQFFLDKADEAGYLEIIPPLLVNEATGYGTGQLPDKEGQMYHATVDDFYLIPTAEVPVTNIYRDVIVKESDFPIKMTAYTPCFRREAGSYGKEVRGLNRLHQFDKVEIVQIEHPDRSYNTLDEMVQYVEGLVKALGLPYRILRLCGGDLSFASALTYDFEVWSGAQEMWLEVSSVSNFESFQANRMKLRYKDANKKSQLAHTLNGSALALPRILAAILENNQQENGSIVIPEALRSYTGFDKIG